MRTEKQKQPLYFNQMCAKIPAVSVSAKKVLKIEPYTNWQQSYLQTLRGTEHFSGSQRSEQWPMPLIAWRLFFSVLEEMRSPGKSFLSASSCLGSVTGVAWVAALPLRLPVLIPPPFRVSYVIISRSTQSNTQHVGWGNQSGVGDSPWRTVPLPPYMDSWRQQSAPPSTLWIPYPGVRPTSRCVL